MSIKFTGDWEKAMAILTNAPSDIDKAANKATSYVANFLVGNMKKRFHGLQPPLSQNTIATKRMGGSKPLIATGDLRNSIAAVKVSDGFFIGVPRSNEHGIRLAGIHEYGKTIVMNLTDKQRKFLHARLPKRESSGSGFGGVSVFHIPARPFIEPTFEENKAKIPELFWESMSESLKGKLSQ